MEEIFPKNTCDAEKVKLTLDSLINVCADGIHNSRCMLEKYEGSIRDNLFKASSPSTEEEDKSRFLSYASTETQYFLRAAKDYAAAIQLYNYLTAANTREEIIILRDNE